METKDFVGQTIRRRDGNTKRTNHPFSSFLGLILEGSASRDQHGLISSRKLTHVVIASGIRGPDPPQSRKDKEEEDNVGLDNLPLGLSFSLHPPFLFFIQTLVFFFLNTFFYILCTRIIIPLTLQVLPTLIKSD
ncbi:hypothetical protein GmHk_01G000310 [Glycine max]|nr:hypothetical protein GmHk_01G000310 [Glycine max]